jgi:hypothetical protein
MKNKLEWQSKQKYKFGRWLREKNLKKQKNLESNNFYVFLKVRRRIYFYYISGPKEYFFDVFLPLIHLEVPTRKLLNVSLTFQQCCI